MIFAQLDFFRKVLKVIVADQDAVDRLAGMWINCEGIKNYPSIGDTYDYERNAFINKKPYPSFVLNEETCKWEAPVSMPENMPCARWNEETQEWFSEA